MAAGALSGRRVVTTRDEPGRLDSLLAHAGADVVHVPLIAIEPVDGALDEIESAIASLPPDGWVVVTSQHGARSVAPALAGRAVRVAAVGTRTDAMLRELTGRGADVVPSRQTAADLVAAMPSVPSRAGAAVVAQADRAEPTLTIGLTERGYDVRAVTAYRTRLRRPSGPERDAALAADAVAFASGSAAEAWAATIGARTPPAVVAIGPTTARVATAAGIAVTHVAAVHDVEGLAAAVETALSDRGAGTLAAADPPWMPPDGPASGGSRPPS